MKYNNRDERNIINELKASKRYESRHSLRCRYDVNQLVNKIRRSVNKGSTFQGLGEVEDKYYRESHYPSADVITEMRGMGEAKKTSWVVRLSAGIGLIILGLALLGKFN